MLSMQLLLETIGRQLVLFELASSDKVAIMIEQ
jgi:hypothetical protein